MSEEEIVKVITYKLNMKNADVYAPILYDEIQNLLDLYKKEKEKTPESIRKQFEIYQNRICELEEKNLFLEGFKVGAEETIKELKESNKEYELILDIGNKRKYRKRYLEERRKEEPNLLYPDADEIYQKYYEEKEKTTKQEKMIQKIHENFCKFDWKNSNGKQVHNQLKELYESIFKNEEN